MEEMKNKTFRFHKHKVPKEAWKLEDGRKITFEDMTSHFLQVDHVIWATGRKPNGPGISI